MMIPSDDINVTIITHDLRVKRAGEMNAYFNMIVKWIFCLCVILLYYFREKLLSSGQYNSRI